MTFRGGGANTLNATAANLAVKVSLFIGGILEAIGNVIFRGNLTVDQDLSVGQDVTIDGTLTVMGSSESNLIHLCTRRTTILTVPKNPNDEPIPVTNYDTSVGEMTADFNTTTGIFTVPADGTYVISACIVYIQPPSQGTRWLYIEVDGDPFLNGAGNDATTPRFNSKISISVTSVFCLNANQEISAAYRHDDNNDVDIEDVQLNIVRLNLG